jgi:hypothetical protein
MARISNARTAWKTFLEVITIFFSEAFFQKKTRKAPLNFVDPLPPNENVSFLLASLNFATAPKEWYDVMDVFITLHVALCFLTFYHFVHYLRSSVDHKIMPRPLPVIFYQGNVALVVDIFRSGEKKWQKKWIKKNIKLYFLQSEHYKLLRSSTCTWSSIS